MANVPHASLTGSEVHEPKGIENATIGEVYVADGNGSGNWAGIGTSSFTGMIADFTWPVVQAGWLECNGQVVSTTTYAALFAVMSFNMVGTRTSGSPFVTSLPSTANMRVGYFLFGPGIAAGTKIQSIDSATQVTLTSNAGSNTTGTIWVSPWRMDTGTVTLPDVSGGYSKYRRGRGPYSEGTANVGQALTGTIPSHTHSFSGSGTTSLESINHTHDYSGTTSSMSANAAHNHTATFVRNDASAPGGVGGGGTFGHEQTNNTSTTNLDHTHSYSGTTTGVSANHNHSFSVSGTTGAFGNIEVRPATLVVMTCVKT